MDSVLKFTFICDDQLSPALGKVGKGITDNNKAIGGFGQSLDKIASKAMGFQSLANSFGAVASVLNDAVAPGIAFNTSMGELSAITGFVGKDLDTLGMSARKNALIFGGDAASAAGVYQRILSDLGPDIAKNGVAMGIMSNNAQIMGKTMKGDVVGAANALDTAMLQYGVNLSDPIAASRTMTEYMNIMGAAAQNGSVEVPQIAQAMEQFGATAKTANVSFAESNAAIQTLGIVGLKGAEAGRSLKNVLINMSAPSVLSKDTLGMAKNLGINLKTVADTSLPLKTRLAELKKGLGDTGFMAGYFGRENIVAGQALLGNIEFLGDMQTKITGTNTTVDMANTIMNTFSERLARSKAATADLGISIFGSTENMIPFMNGAVGMAEKYSQLYPAISLVGSGFTWVTTTIGAKIAATRLLVAEQGFLNTVMNSSIVTMGMQAASFIFTGISAAGSFVIGLGTATLSMIGLNVAMYANPVGVFIAGFVAIGVAVGTAVYLVVNHWEWLKTNITKGAIFLAKLSPFYWLIEAVDYLFPSFKTSIGEFFTSIYDDYIAPFMDSIGAIWDKVKAIVNPFTSDMKVSVGVGVVPNVSLGEKGIGLTGKDASLFNVEDMNAGTKFNYATGKYDAAPASGKVDKKLSSLNSGGKDKDKKKKDAEVTGDGKASRTVNTRIDKIIINVNAKGEEAALRQTGDKFGRQLVDSVRDFETIIAN